MMEMSFYSDRKALSVVIMYLFYRLLKENITLGRGRTSAFGPHSTHL